MGNSESNWRSQLSFIFSLLLHAGAIALIALGPTMIENRFGNNGTQPQPVDMTIVNPPSAPKVVAVKPAPVTVKAAPVVIKAKPQVRRVRKIAKVVVPKPVVAKAAIAKPVTPKPVAPIPVVKKEAAVAAPAPAPVKTVVASAKPAPPQAPISQPQPKIQPQPIVPPQPQPQQQATAAKSAGPASPSISGTPTGSKTIAVTQNYLSLRQMPGNQPPAYTRVMRLNREQGVGQLVYFVNRDGTVSDVRLTKSTGFPDLDKAAVDAFSKYRFVPGQQGYTVHNFEFVLNGPAIADGPGLRTTMN